jgi:hypothetical protein
LKPLQTISRLGLEAEAEFLAVAEHFLDHQALLVHLDREHRGVAVAVVVLRDRARKGCMQVAQAMCQDVRETDDQRRGQVTVAQALDHFQQVDFVRRRGVRPHHDVPGRVDREVARAPGRDVVELGRVVAAPAATGVHGPHDSKSPLQSG